MCLANWHAQLFKCLRYIYIILYMYMKPKAHVYPTLHTCTVHVYTHYNVQIQSVHNAGHPILFQDTELKLGCPALCPDWRCSSCFHPHCDVVITVHVCFISPTLHTWEGK